MKSFALAGAVCCLTASVLAGGLTPSNARSETSPATNVRGSLQSDHATSNANSGSTTSDAANTASNPPPDAVTSPPSNGAIAQNPAIQGPSSTQDSYRSSQDAYKAALSKAEDEHKTALTSCKALTKTAQRDCRRDAELRLKVARTEAQRLKPAS
jgi:hypothetical protein